MHSTIQRLYGIANKPARVIIGLMSGTSFDGLDIALCEFTGSGSATTLRLLQFVTKEYAQAFKEELKSVFAKASVNLEKVALLNAYIGSYYAELVNTSLAEWGMTAGEIDLIASHGLSIFHSPKRQRAADPYGNATLQIGDGDHLAIGTGIITFSDFRQKHIAAGGEGAPLAVYGDWLLFSDPRENRIMLNIGGIANFTWLPANDPGGCWSTDVGPGNTLMDQYVQSRFPGMYYDKDSAIGSRGMINKPLLDALFDHPFFKATFPKTTGPELFNLGYLQGALDRSGQSGLSPEDILATLAFFSAGSIIEAISGSAAAGRDFGIYASGGGIYNRLLVGHLESHFHQKLKSTSALEVNPDAKEAVLFALLANEAVAGKKAVSTNSFPMVSMGKISCQD